MVPASVRVWRIACALPVSPDWSNGLLTARFAVDAVGDAQPELELGQTGLQVREIVLGHGAGLLQDVVRVDVGPGEPFAGDHPRDHLPALVIAHLLEPALERDQLELALARLVQISGGRMIR